MFILGSLIRIFSIPGFWIQGQKDSGSGIRSKVFLTKKNCFQALGNMIRKVHPGSQIPDPDLDLLHGSRGPKKAPDPGSGSATLVCFMTRLIRLANNKALKRGKAFVRQEKFQEFNAYIKKSSYFITINLHKFDNQNLPMNIKNYHIFLIWVRCFE
jgi:hypothetical protein